MTQKLYEAEAKIREIMYSVYTSWNSMKDRILAIKNDPPFQTLCMLTLTVYKEKCSLFYKGLNIIHEF